MPAISILSWSFEVPWQTFDAVLSRLLLVILQDVLPGFRRLLSGHDWVRQELVFKSLEGYALAELIPHAIFVLSRDQLRSAFLNRSNGPSDCRVANWADPIISKALVYFRFPFFRGCFL